MLKDYNDFAADEDYRRAELEEKAPKCELCGEPLDDFCYNVEGVRMCYDCLCNEYREAVY